MDSETASSAMQNRAGNGSEPETKTGRQRKERKMQRFLLRRSGASTAFSPRIDSKEKPIITLSPLPFRFGCSVHSRCPTGFLSDEHFHGQRSFGQGNNGGVERFFVA